MRVLFGLAALAAVNAQTLNLAGAGTGAVSLFPPTSLSAVATLSVTNGLTSTQPAFGASPSFTQGASLTPGAFSYTITLPNSVSLLTFAFFTNPYTSQLQYRFSPGNTVPAGTSANAFVCDTCAGGTYTSCSTNYGPGTAPSPVTGYPCANLARTYSFGSLAASPAVNIFAVVLYDQQTNPGPDVSSYSFTIIRSAPVKIVGDPQIVGMQGQDFQVHGMPDEIFNIVTYPTVQINARFSYLESAECFDNFTACFAHPGTYISEEGFRIGKDKIRVQAGSFKKGLTVTVNGKKAHKNVDLKHGAVEIVNHRRVVVHTEVMTITVSNSDKFLNQELELADDKLISLGSTRTLLKDNQRFHAEVPLHGLQGQTWRNVEYASGLEYEGSIMDYHVVDGNLFGTDFVFNQFQA